MGDDATQTDPASVLETLSDRAVPGSERSVIGLWRLRAALGATGRANSVWAARGDGRADGRVARSVADAVDGVVAWYRARDLPPRFQLYDASEPALVDELDRRAWHSASETLAMVAAADVITSAGLIRSGSWDRPELTTNATPTFARLVGDDQRLTEVTTSGLPQRFITVSDGGVLLGGGMCTLDGSWAGIGSMKTHHEARRRGVATAVLAALVKAATAAGAERLWLQVEAGNDGAMNLYERIGFTTAHRYRYRTAPDR